MIAYLAKRLLWMIPILLAITFLNFLLYNLAPGDPVTMMLNPALGATGTGARMTLEQIERFIEVQREIKGLNRPWYERYWLWLAQVARGNLGRSMVSSGTVAEIILSHAWPTIQLNLLGIVISAVFGVALGLLQAIYKYSIFDYVAAFLSFFYVSMPGFFLALILIYVFALRLGWLPTDGITTFGVSYSLGDRLWHLILPAATLSLGGLPSMMRITRTAMLEVLSADYIRTARAKGLVERIVMLRHALRNCLIPVTTLVGGMVMWTFSGSIVVERIFQWPGLGLLFLRVVGEQDYSTIMGLVLINSMISVLVILLTDIAYTVVDPRVRLE